MVMVIRGHGTEDSDRSYVCGAFVLTLTLLGVIICSGILDTVSLSKNLGSWTYPHPDDSSLKLGHMASTVAGVPRAADVLVFGEGPEAPTHFPILLKFVLWFILQISQKKLKKYEKEYHTMREQQAQQEDPIERFEVGLLVADVL